MVMKIGYWCVECESDSRWNKNGRAVGDGIFGPQEMHDWIKECKEKYGNPPEDATLAFMKD